MSPKIFKTKTKMGYVKRYQFKTKPMKDDIEYVNFQTAIHFYPIVEGIAPRVYSFSYDADNLTGEIVVEKLINRNEDLFTELIESNYDLFNDIVHQKVKILHDMDIAHGDLHLDNIVLTQNPFDVFFIDWDKAFYISSGNSDKRVLNWMNEAFDFDTYEEFVRNDYENYKLDLDDLLKM